MEDEMATVTTSDMWSAAFCAVRGIRIVGYVPTRDRKRIGVVLDDSDGKASAALTEWRFNSPLVSGRALISIHGEILTAAKNGWQ